LDPTLLDDEHASRVATGRDDARFDVDRRAVLAADPNDVALGPSSPRVTRAAICASSVPFPAPLRPVTRWKASACNNGLSTNTIERISTSESRRQVTAAVAVVSASRAGAAPFTSAARFVTSAAASMSGHSTNSPVVASW
jgi:hypothetical protein